MSEPFADLDEETKRALRAYGQPLERQTVRVAIRDIGGYSFDELPQFVGGWIEWMEEARAEAPEQYREDLRCDLSYDSGWRDDSGSATLAVWYERPETDEEMCERIGQGLAWMRESQNRERAEFERLKKKFGG
jgi:hypothetical protein